MRGSQEGRLLEESLPSSSLATSCKPNPVRHQCRLRSLLLTRVFHPLCCFPGLNALHKSPSVSKRSKISRHPLETDLLEGNTKQAFFIRLPDVVPLDQPVLSVRLLVRSWGSFPYCLAVLRHLSAEASGHCPHLLPQVLTLSRASDQLARSAGRARKAEAATGLRAQGPHNSRSEPFLDSAILKHSRLTRACRVSDTRAFLGHCM